MGQNEQSCKSIRCCCKLISKVEEKPAAPVVATKPRNNGCGGRAERPAQMSLCDFLKTQPIPDWIKVNDLRQQQQPNQQRPMQPCAPDQPKASSTSEDVQSSQIIINFGTVVTNGPCKQDSCQQTDPEVQQKVCPIIVSPAPAKPSMPCNCPPAKPSMSKCPPADRPAFKCPPAERPTSKCPPADRPTSKCIPADRSTSKCPPANRSSVGPVHATQPPAAPARDRCSREKAAVSSPPPKTCPESTVKKDKCACNCHSN
ncbi:vegetative cell wall protein gp1-like [Myzus persicae]|uniref:vegetative cell wall protein gp1-like n=1 Tax=Myzus persicae TaxID=13164 RepID=UPI000B934DA2|nr:vegetative cell wall protein gp1-like [Myzus persicae]